MVDKKALKGFFKFLVDNKVIVKEFPMDRFPVLYKEYQEEVERVHLPKIVALVLCDTEGRFNKLAFIHSDTVYAVQEFDMGVFKVLYQTPDERDPCFVLTAVNPETDEEINMTQWGKQLQG